MISPIYIKDSEQKFKQEWSLLDPIVYLFEKTEEGVEFDEAENTPFPGGGVVSISYLLILRTGSTGKSHEKWEDMQVGQNNWQAFNDHFAQSYRYYQILQKATATAHGYVTPQNCVHETDA